MLIDIKHLKEIDSSIALHHTQVKAWYYSTFKNQQNEIK